MTKNLSEQIKKDYGSSVELINERLDNLNSEISVLNELKQELLNENPNNLYNSTIIEFEATITDKLGEYFYNSLDETQDFLNDSDFSNDLILESFEEDFYSETVNDLKKISSIHNFLKIEKEIPEDIFITDDEDKENAVEEYFELLVIKITEYFNTFNWKQNVLNSIKETVEAHNSSGIKSYRA